MLPARYGYIAIEGPIGVGKTTLARRLAQRCGAQLLLEQPQDNPFLERFYRDRKRYALPTQLFFLFQRVQQLAELRQPDLFHGPVIADFLLDKDALFARLTLADDELRLYEQILAQVAPQAQTPDLVLYLQAPPEVLIERVQRRSVPMENAIGTAYLRQLADSYLRFFHDYDGAPVLVVNTEALNPADRDDDLDLLITRIERLRGCREYFNLAP